MNSDELLEMLDLKNTRAGPTTEPALVVSSTPLEATSSHATALEVDAWGLRRGEELLRCCDRIQSLKLDGAAVADCHAAAFDPEPRILPACVDPRRTEYFAALLETPDYRALHQSTKLDVNAAEIAAVHFAEELAKFFDETANEQSDSVERDVAALKAVSRALSAARDEVAECRDMVAAFGLGPGSPGNNDPKAIAELFRRVRNDAALKAICTLAGRYRRLAQSRQRRKTRHGLDDVVGVELGGDLGRVLPHELVKLTTPPFDLEALRRFSERQLMSREHHASEPVGRGPIVVVVDESGSMAGDPVHSAKAIALALAWIARQQRRWCALVAFSGDSGERLLALPAGKWNESALAEWLIAFLGRGSTLDVPIAELPRMMIDLHAPLGETDVIVITDCICQIPLTLREPFNVWKHASQTRVITLVVGDDAGDLTEVSDEVHLVRSLAVGEASVGCVLSI